MKKYTTVFLLLLIGMLLNLPSMAQTNLNQKPELLLRVDDIGMNHAVNMAVKDLAQSGIPFSTSVTFATPWYQEAVAILQDHPQVSVGVHLTLNAEWMHYRWGPVLGREAVPSLVDSVGYFLPSVDAFLKSNYKLEEVEKELSAQIERALSSGLKIDYVDPHMGMAVATPELRAIVEKLAARFQLGISTYFGEEYKTMWGVPVDRKKQEFMSHLQNLKNDRINLVEFHIAHANPEMEALKDLNSSLMNTDEGKPQASQHRQTELDVLLSPDFQDLIGKNFKLITYGDLIRQKGTSAMSRPE